MKNFTNNFKQFTSRLSARWLIMALMMLVGTSSAWAYCTSYNGNYKVYFDASTIKFAEGKTVNLMFEKSDGSGGVTMSQVSGTRYLYLWNSSDWGSCNVTKLAFFLADGAWGWEGNKLDSRKGYALAATNIHTLNSNISSNCLFSGNLTRTSNYTLPTYTITLNIVGSGSVTIKNNAGTALISNATASTSRTGVQYLTYLKNITATAGSGYKLSSIKIGSTDYTDAYKSGSDTNDGYDLTGNVTITVTFEQDCITPDAPFGGEAQSETICKGSPYEFDSNYKWYTGSTGETTVSGSEEIYSNTDYYIVNVAPEGCESARTKYTINVDEPLVAPTLIPTNPTTCNGNPTAGSIVIENYANYSNEISFALYKDENPTGIAYNNGFAISEEGSYKVVMTTSASNVCGQSVETEPISIEIVDVTPTVNSFAITKQANVCMGNPVTLSYDGTAQSGTISYAWYEGDSEVVIGTESTLTIQQAKNASYKLVVTVTSNDCPASAEATTTVEPKAVPSAPTFDKYEMDACVNQQFTLPMPNNLKYEEEPLWTVDGLPTTASQTINVDGEYTYTAYKNDGCPSQGTPFTVRVNPLPTINIGENVTAVKFEDVVLTATGNNIADVTWTADKGTITKDATDPKRAVLTYDQADAVIVTATATSAAGCTSVAATKTVTFSAEDCNSTTITDLIITCNPNGYYGDVYLHIWPNGEGSLQSWPGFKGEWKDNVWRWEISASLLNTSKKYDIIFNNNDGAQTQDLDHDLIPGNQYNYTLNHTDWGNGNNRPTMGKVDPIPLSQPAAITAPTVKTVYAESDEGEGNIRFKGQVVKTGCNDKAKLAVQYKLDGNDSYTTYYWNNEDKLVDIEAGKEFEITLTNIPDGTYDVRARIYVSDDLKGYGEVITIPVSTTKIPITSVTLTHVKNQAGEPYSAQEQANLTYCAGETVWFKLEQDGSKFQDYQWISYPGTDLVGMYAAGTFSLTITDSGDVGIRLKNDANDDWVESNLLEFKTHPVAISPTISFENATICSNSTATLKLGSLVVGQSYELYKEIENEGVYSEERVGDVTLTCNSIEDDLKFTGLNESGKYFVKGYTAQCPDYKASSQTATLEIVDESSVYITLDPTDATTTPWMPVKLTVAASDDYTLEVPEGVEFNQNGNICSVKIPLPQGSTGGEGQYDNVSFPQDATTSYTVTAKLVSTGGEDNPCATPASATITLTPYVEECTIGH